MARFSGVPTGKIRIKVYSMSGALAGLAALIMTSRIASARPDLGTNLNLQAISIAVLGGASILGGEGSISGTLMAIAIITVLYNGLQLAGVNTIWQMGTLGIVLIASTLLNVFLRKKFST